MADQNPFAPPSATADRPQGTGLVFSPEGARVVASLASWMRGLSIVYYIAAAGLLVSSCSTLAMVGSGPYSSLALGMAVVIIIAVGLIALAASWLSSAGSDFERGVISDDEFPIGQGFRSLRNYLILFGVLGILTLLSAISNALEMM